MRQEAEKLKYLYDVKDMLCRELEDISRRGEIGGAQELEAIDKLTHSIKSIDTIIAMEEAGYSNDGDSYRGGYRGSYDGGSYARGRGQRRDSRGRFMSNDDGYSSRMYDPYYYDGYRRNGYSRAEAKDQMIEQMRDAMQNTSSEETKEAIRKAIQMMEKEQQ